MNFRAVLFLIIISYFYQECECSAGYKFDYFKSGDDWEGTCRTGNTQSPIDIPTFRESNSTNVGSIVYNENLSILI